MIRIKQAGPDNLWQVNLTTGGRYDLGMRIQRMKRAQHALSINLIDQVQLIDNLHITELDLIGQQVSQRPQILVSECQAAIYESFDRAKVAQEIRGIDHGHHRVQFREVSQ